MPSAQISLIRFFITLLLVGINAVSHAQLIEVIKENFDASGTDWKSYRAQNFSCGTIRGKYQIQWSSTDGRAVPISIGTDFKSDFILQATVRQTAGDTDLGFGIGWGYNDQTGESNYFAVTSNGHARTWVSDLARQTECVWQRVPMAKPIGHDNLLRIEKSGDVLTFKINGQVVFKRANFNVYGSKLAVVLEGSMTVLVDDFYYSEKPTEPVSFPEGEPLPLLAEEDFSTNTGEWPTGKSDLMEAAIQNGQYEIAFLNKQGGQYLYKNFYLNPDKDFDIETEITQLQTEEDEGFGLVWGFKNQAKMFGFITNQNGNVLIYHAHDSIQALLPRKKFLYTNANGKPNVLRVAQRNQQWFFFINNQFVYQCAAQSWYGANIGIEVNKRMRMVVQRITVRQIPDAINLVPDLPKTIEKEPLQGFNTTFDETAPRLSPDGQRLYFSRQAGSNDTAASIEVWVSQREQGLWSHPINIGPPINNAGPNMVVSVSPDNNALILMNTYQSNGTPRGSGLSQSFRTANGWSLPIDLKIDDYYNNSPYHETCMSANQKVLVFAIERNDSKGDRDLYVSFLKPDGTWTAPRNLGNDVNSLADEGAPCLASDDRTLYFSSTGWPGYGNKDIFVSRRLDDTWQHWSKPQNLGPAINTPQWDSYYTLSAAGNYAIVSSPQVGMQGDLFRLELPANARPSSVTLVSGKVLNANTMQPVEATISYEILTSGAEAGLARAHPVTGEYKIVLNYGASYGLHANATGYIAVNEFIELAHSGPYQEVKKDLLLVPLTVGQIIKLNNVFFVQSKAGLKQESLPELDRLVTILKENPNMKIELLGHTDNQGKKKLNQELSEMRVVAVLNYLREKGIARHRMTGQGYGDTKPLAPNDTEENRQKNRRVEFRIVSN